MNFKLIMAVIVIINTTLAYFRKMADMLIEKAKYGDKTLGIVDTENKG